LLCQVLAFERSTPSTWSEKEEEEEEEEEENNLSIWRFDVSSRTISGESFDFTIARDDDGTGDRARSLLRAAIRAAGRAVSAWERARGSGLLMEPPSPWGGGGLSVN